MKTYILTGFWIFLFIYFDDHIIKCASRVLLYISVGKCGFSSGKLAPQKSKLEMLLSQVKLKEMFAMNSIRST